MDYKDYYRILGVERNAGADEIKKAFRHQAREHHPDVNPGDSDAEERFKEINEAFQVLSDPEKRQRYDQFGSQWQQYTNGGGRPEDFNWSSWGAPHGGQHARARTVSPEEFEQFMGGNSDFFETLFGMNARRGGFNGYSQVRSRKGRDIEYPLEITLEEAFHGTLRSIRWEDGREINARIPRGVREGSRVRLAGQGEAGVGGGGGGDLYLKISVVPHAVYQRKVDDLYLTLPVDLYTTLLGGEIPVSTLDSTVQLSIPPETANGRVFRLEGLGMPLLREPDKHGDLYVKVRVELPKSLSDKEVDLLRQLQTMRR